MIPQKQLSLAEIYSDCKSYFENDKPHFLALLETTINLDDLIPSSFINHFYASTGRPRKYPLKAMLWALILQRLFSIPTDTLLIIFLTHSKELRDFCGFTKVPDASKFTRFKQDFLSDLQSMFHHLVDLTEPICQSIDAHKASMTIFDTSGIEAFVTENNPKYANKVVKQLYINGHFCYVYKFGLITNGLGIVRDISFYNKDFLEAHPEIIIEKKTDSPDEDKSLHDSKALIPVLIDFFAKHPLINPKTFIGDAAFDSSTIYKSLLHDLKFQHVYIPLNNRSKIINEQCPINEDGIPCCPIEPDTPMKYEGIAKRKNGLVRYKFVCPKVKWVKSDNGKYKRQCYCEAPCTSSSCGRMFYVYPEKDLRAYPGVLRGTDEWI